VVDLFETGEHSVIEGHMISAEQIVECRPRMLRYVLRIIHNPTNAEDVVSQAMLKAVAKADQFRGESKLSTWLLSIARREAFMYLRASHAVKRAKEIELTEEFEPSTGKDDIVNDLIVRERLDRAIDVIARLPFAQREAMFLFIQFDGDTQAVARVLHVHMNTLKSRLFNARKCLRKTEGCVPVAEHPHVRRYAEVCR
jgi:RNA polymerase sigma-70 factor, ECF subfamily